jgi:hypothetical protein
MMLPILLTFLTAASATDAQVAIVERSTLGISAQAGSQLRGKLKLALEEVGLEVVLSGASCADRPCLLAQSQTHGTCVVGMTVVKNRKGLTVDLEAVKAGEVVLQQTFLLTNEKLETSPDAQVFAHQLQGKLVKPLEKDTPVVEKRLSPPLAEVKPEWLEPAPPSGGPRVLGVVSAGVGAVAIGLLIASAVVKGGLDSSLQEKPFVTSRTRAEAQQQADITNALFGIGMAGLGLGVAGGATALGLGFAAE